MKDRPILIIGAGISGLSLAQACRKHHLPYRLFERDASAASRSAGWGLTLNWSLETFRSLLPDDVLARLPETYVNLAAVEAGEKGTFTFFDLSTGHARWRTPTAGERIRVSRERLRKVMLSGVDVEWGKTLVSLSPAEHSVTATFSDGSEVEGCLLVGCDGAGSQVRRLCHPHDYENSRLPVRFIGAGVLYLESKVAAMKKLDPFFLQGSDPERDVFMWFSFLDTPTDPATVTNGTKSDGLEHANTEPMYRCQIMTSYPYRPGVLGREMPIELPESHTGKLELMKQLAAGFASPFRELVQGIPHESEVKEVYLADYLPRSTSTTPLGKECGGRVALIGDAAHAMVMYRGEGANHAIVDVARLVELVKPLIERQQEGLYLDELDEEWETRVQVYEVEMIERTELAVRASRQACLDAHDHRRLDERSPLVRKRLMRADLEEVGQV